MIEHYLVSELNTIDALNGQSYPVAVPAGALEGAFCIYTRVSGEIQRDLSGNPVLYRDVFRLDLYHEDTDVLFELERNVIDRLTKNNVELDDVYIYSAEAAPGTPDGFDLTVETAQRSVMCALTYWR